jgi:hypothetical protein
LLEEWLKDESDRLEREEKKRQDAAAREAEKEKFE